MDAAKLELEPITVYELVTFYPMFRQGPVGKFHFKICGPLSCALGGANELHAHLCQKLGLRPRRARTSNHPGWRIHGRVCRVPAGCGSAPVMMVNDDFYEGVPAKRPTKSWEMPMRARQDQLDKMESWLPTMI